MNTPSSPIARTGAALAVALAAAIGATTLEAQRPALGARASAGHGPVERAIRLADELELTADQRTQLEAIRIEVLERRTAQAAAGMALRSEIAAGMREPEALREALAEQWREGRDDRRSLADRLGGILTEAQQDELRRMTRRAGLRQGGVAGRDRIDRRRGPRGGRPFDGGRRPSRSSGRGR